VFIVKFPVVVVVVVVVVVYVAISLVNEDIMLMFQYKVSFTFDRLGGRCFSFVHIHICIAVLLCCYRFSVTKNLYITKLLRKLLLCSILYPCVLS